MNTLYKKIGVVVLGFIILAMLIMSIALLNSCEKQQTFNCCICNIDKPISEIYLSITSNMHICKECNELSIEMWTIPEK